MPKLSDFSADRLLGGTESIAQYEGKVVLVVNVASKMRLHPAIHRARRALENLWREGFRHPRLPL
jgi:glutathione peroxidase-family protein